MINYHFQLDPDKPDEGLALDILERWQLAGWNLQKILVMALLLLDQRRTTGLDSLADEMRKLAYDVTDHTSSTLEEANRVLRNVQRLLQDLEQSPPTTPKTPTQPQQADLDAITPGFLDALKKVVRPGMSSDD